MDNLNDDERKLAAARLTLERAEAVRLGRKIREQQQRRALLPVFAITKAFGALYPGDKKRYQVAREATVLLALLDNKLFVSLWVAMVTWLSTTLWIGRFSWAVPVLLVIATAIVVTMIGISHSAFDKLGDDLTKDLAALQPVLGEDPLKWVGDIVDKDDLAGFIDEKLSTELREEKRNVRDRKSLTTMWTATLTERFGMKFPKTETALREVGR